MDELVCALLEGYEGAMPGDDVLCDVAGHDEAVEVDRVYRVTGVRLRPEPLLMVRVDAVVNATLAADQVTVTTMAVGVQLVAGCLRCKRPPAAGCLMSHRDAVWVVDSSQAGVVRLVGGEHEEGQAGTAPGSELGREGLVLPGHDGAGQA